MGQRFKQAAIEWVRDWFGKSEVEHAPAMVESLAELLSENARESPAKIDTFSVTLANIGAKNAVAYLIDQSRWFTATPLPDDNYRVEIKEELGPGRTYLSMAARDYPPNQVADPAPDKWCPYCGCLHCDCIERRDCMHRGESGHRTCGRCKLNPELPRFNCGHVSCVDLT